MSDFAANNPDRNMESGSPGRKDDVRKGEMTYHYAGKVHVRGLLRRVWRPRYLALGDDGYLRYHESIPPLFQQDPQHNNPYSMSISDSSSSHEIYSLHNTHRPKTILAILDGARTIDPYSVVDRHVALPQGVYGFVFRGRPVELHTTDSGRTERGGIATGHNHDAEQGALILPPENPSNDAFSPGSQSSKHSTKAAVVNLVFPKGTERRRTAQKIAKQAVNPDVLSCFGRTPNSFEGGLPSHNSSSSSLMGYEQPLIEEESANNQWGIDSHESMGSYQRVDSSQVCGDLSDDQPPQTERMQTSAQPKSTVQVQVQAASIQSREYLCAVSTAEEAESWVVALRWAAEHRRRIRYERAAPRRNESTATASVPHDAVKKSAHPFNANEQLGPGSNEEVGGSNGDGINPIDSALGPMSESKEGCDSESGDGSANKDFGGDSKESLNSLLIEQEGWCKTVLEENAEPLFPEEIDEPAQCTPKKEVAQTGKAESPSRSHPTIVVTKVCKVRPPENVSLGFAAEGQRPNDAISLLPLRWALPGSDLLLQYEIQLLLLRNCKRSKNIVRPESVEEHNICKALPEMLDLIRNLIQEFDAGKNGLDEDGVDRNHATPRRKGSGRPPIEPNDTVHLLEDVEFTLQQCLESIASIGLSAKLTAKGPMNDVSSCMSSALTSVRIADDAMRKLSKDGNICSSERFQEFLGLHASHFHHQPARPREELSGADAEHIVKWWLGEKSHPSMATKAQLLLGITLRHQLGGPFLSMIALWSAARLASLLWSAVSGSSIVISIPFETYTTLVALAFFLGHYNGMSSSSPDRRVLERRSAPKRPKPASAEARVEEYSEESMHVVDDDHSTVADEGSESGDETFIPEPSALSSPLPTFPDNRGISCWSKPDHQIFMVRSSTYLDDRVKLPSAPAVFHCRGVDVWITDNAERNIARHPSVLGGELHKEDTFVVNFLLPFANLVAYFTIPPIEQMPANVAEVWTRFIRGDQEYRDGKLKLLPVVVDGPWIVKKAVGPGTAPAMIGRDLPLQYYFSEPTATKKGVYEVDVLVTASRIARGILNVVKGHTKSLTIAFAFIIEASEEAHLPETVLCAFQMHCLHLEDCPNLPDCYPDG